MAEPAVARAPRAPVSPEPAPAARRPPPRHTAPPVHRLRAVATLPASGSVPPPAYDVVVAPGPGDPLPQAVRAPLQRSLGIDLDEIRIHDDRRARDAARSVGARAFTYGVHVYLGAGESATNLDLISHEVAHAVQQQGSPALQAYGGRSDALEREATSISQSVRQGEQVRVSGRTAPRVQRSLLGRAWDATGGRVVHAVEEGVEAGIQWLEDRAWGLVRRFAPELEPILRQGIIEWLKERIGAALEAVWNTLMAPVRSVTDFIETLRGHFRNLVDWMREAATKLAHGDCSSISEAAQKVQDVVTGLASPVIDRVKHAAQRVGDFFTNLWNRFGAPVWQWLRELGGAIWERIQAFGSWLWEKTQPIRDALSRAWTWIKNKLGVGEGPEGQNGLLQWVQRKAGEAWDWLKARIEPYKRKLLVIAGVLVMLSPAGPIIAIGAAVGGLIYGARWLAQRLRSRDAVVQDRGLLEGRIIPAIQGAVGAVASGLSRAAAWVTDKLTTLVGHFSSAAGAIAGSIFRFALGAVQWLLSRFQSLAAWATEQVQGLAGHVRSGLNRLLVWLQPVFEVLRKLGRVVANIFAIVELVVGRVWNAIPACIRDPIVNFLTNQILRRIPIFSSLLAIPDIWNRIRTTAMRVIQQVFRDGDLAGAAMTVFRFLLDVLRVPVQLVVQIFQKAQTAMDVILADPARFLRNVLSALKQGFSQFFGNILRHLLSGIANWLFGQLQDAGITVPSDFSFGSIFRLILQILGITLDRVLTILARKVGQPVVDRIRRFINFMTGVWEFVSRLITDGPAGMWRYLTERLSDLWNTALDAIIGWMTSRIIARVTARLLSMLDPTGIMAVVNSIIAFYNAVQSAIEYLRQILEIVDHWLDMVIGIAQGAIGAAADRFEALLDRALPVAIGFLANQVGLGSLGSRIREMVERLQERVEQAIEWVIDRALAVGRTILEGLGVGRQEAEAPAATQVKTEALRDVESTLRARHVATTAALHGALAEIHGRYRARGLRSLDGSLEDNGAVSISASASLPNRVSLGWNDVFRADQQSNQGLYQQLFETMRERAPGEDRARTSETYAAVVVNGDLIAAEQNAQRHAEAELMASAGWQHALTRADTEGRPDHRADFVVLINRSPCKAICTDRLANWLRSNRDRHTNVRFILAPSGRYSPEYQKEDMVAMLVAKLEEQGHVLRSGVKLADIVKTLPMAKVREAFEREFGGVIRTRAREDEITTEADLATLARAGWDLRQLQIRAARSPAEGALVAMIDRVRADLKSEFAQEEHA